VPVSKHYSKWFDVYWLLFKISPIVSRQISTVANETTTSQSHPMTARLGPSRELNSWLVLWPMKVSTTITD